MCVSDHGRREYRERFGWVDSVLADFRELYVPLVRWGFPVEERVRGG